MVKRTRKVAKGKQMVPQWVIYRDEETHLRVYGHQELDRRAIEESGLLAGARGKDRTKATRAVLTMLIDLRNVSFLTDTPEAQGYLWKKFLEAGCVYINYLKLHRVLHLF